jgi:hypothetical protein
VTAVALVFGGVVGAAITFSTVFVLMRILAWVVVEGIPSMISRRSEAVVGWQDCDQQGRRSGWDDHVDTALEVLLTHEAGVADGATPERWIALEEEFADLDDLAAQLGERAQ